MKTAITNLDGKTIGFVAREVAKAYDCTGCLFAACKSHTCISAGKAAKEVGQPDCEDVAPSGSTYIYVEADPRQEPLLEAER